MTKPRFPGLYTSVSYGTLFNFLLRNELNGFTIRYEHNIAVKGSGRYKGSVFFITLLDVEILKNIGA